MNIKITLRIKLSGLFICFALFSCNSGNNHLDRSSKIKLKQYIVEGRKLYLQNCANCHGAEGQGLKRVIPPVKDVDFLLKFPEKSICIIKYGAKTPITVNNVEFIQKMPDNPQLTDLEIAELITFLTNQWNQGETKLFSVSEVSDILNNCNPN